MTMQIRDTVVFQGEEYTLIEPHKIKDFKKELGLHSTVIISSGDGCDARYIVREDKLILDGLALCLGKPENYPSSINNVRPLKDIKEDQWGALRLAGDGKMYSNLNLQIDYTGIIRIGKDYQHRGPINLGPFGCNYLTKLILEFKNDILISQRDISDKNDDKFTQFVLERYVEEKDSPLNKIKKVVELLFPNRK